MKQARRSVVVLALIGLLIPSAALADLTSDIRGILTDKLIGRDQVGVEIIRLGASPSQSVTIYQLKATTPRVPASNLKVVTTATALEKLGADFNFKTTLVKRNQDIAMIGDGDPTLGDAEMLKKVGWGVDTVFKAWAERLKAQGITEVRNVYVDDSIFDENFMHPNWPADQEHKRYVAQVGGVNLNANCIDFYLRTTGGGQVVNYSIEPNTSYANIRNTCLTGGENAVWLSRQLGTNEIVLRGQTNASNQEPIAVTIHDPPRFAATVLAETLKSNGIRITGTVERDRTIRQSLGSTTQPADLAWTAVAVHTTPLVAVLNRANKDSMNLYAEALCKRVGAAGANQPGSWDNGTANVGSFLRSLGVAQDEFNLDDGCGLSKKNTISPHAIAMVLEHKFHGKNREMYLGSLAVAATDGTLVDRFKGTDLRGRVFGKSGYVSGVRALSGYLKARDGQFYAFSILMNGVNEAEVNPKVLQEKIVDAVDRANAGRVAAGQ